MRPASDRIFTRPNKSSSNNARQALTCARKSACGSLLPLGGQNLLEACAWGKPVLFGPHMFNFMQISEAALAAGAACQLTDATQVFRQVAELLSSNEVLDPMADAAIGFAERDKGATQRTVELLESILN